MEEVFQEDDSTNLMEDDRQDGVGFDPTADVSSEKLSSVKQLRDMFELKKQSQFQHQRKIVRLPANRTLTGLQSVFERNAETRHDSRSSTDWQSQRSSTDWQSQRSSIDSQRSVEWKSPRSSREFQSQRSSLELRNQRSSLELQNRKSAELQSQRSQLKSVLQDFIFSGNSSEVNVEGNEDEIPPYLVPPPTPNAIGLEDTASDIPVPAASNPDDVVNSRWGEFVIPPAGYHEDIHRDIATEESFTSPFTTPHAKTRTTDILNAPETNDINTKTPDVDITLTETSGIAPTTPDISNSEPETNAPLYTDTPDNEILLQTTPKIMNTELKTPVIPQQPNPETVEEEQDVFTSLPSVINFDTQPKTPVIPQQPNPETADEEENVFTTLPSVINVETRPKDEVDRAKPTDLDVAIQQNRDRVISYLNHIPVSRATIHEASWSNDLKSLIELLNSGADIDAVDSSGNRAIQIASSQGHLEVLKILVGRGARMVSNKDEFSPLHAAAQFGHAAVVEWLLDHEADVDALAIGGQTALFLAAGEGSINVIKKLVERGAKMISNKDGFSPLHAAAQFGHVAVVEWLLERGADIDQIANDGQTALFLAAGEDHLDVVKLLAGSGAGMINANGKFSSLHVAAQFGHARVVQWLLDDGFGVEVTTDEGLTPLFIAALNGNVGVVKMLLERGANKEAANKDGFRTLHIATQFAHVAVVRALIDAGVDVDARANDGQTALFLAAGLSLIEVVKVLVEGGAKMIAANGGFAPIHVTAQFGHLPELECLLEHGADMEAITDEGQTALFVASMCDQLEVIEVLIEHGASMTGNKDGFTPLHIAAKEGHVGVVKRLLQLGLNVEDLAKDGQTALFLAAGYGHLEVVETLLEHCATLVGNKGGFNPLHGAARNGHVRVVDWLLGKGANIEALTNDGQTALFSAASYCQLDVVKTLVEHGASMIGNKDGYTPLHAGVQFGFLSVVEWLLDSGVDIDATANLGQTALYVASGRTNLDIIKVLTQRGAKHSPNKKGMTPLHNAAQTGNVAATRWLLDNGANIEAVTNDNQTPLYMAVASGAMDVVKVLLERNASMLGNKNGSKPLHVAAKVGNVAAIEMLLEHGADVDAVDNAGETALYQAHLRGDRDVLEVLKVHGASVARC